MADRRVVAGEDADQVAATDPLGSRYVVALRLRPGRGRESADRERVQIQSLCAQIDSDDAVAKAMVQVDIVDPAGQLVSASVERYEVRARRGASGWVVTGITNPSEFNPGGT